MSFKEYVRVNTCFDVRSNAGQNLLGVYFSLVSFSEL